MKEHKHYPRCPWCGATKGHTHASAAPRANVQRNIPTQEDDMMTDEEKEVHQVLKCYDSGYCALSSITEALRAVFNKKRDELPCGDKFTYTVVCCLNAGHAGPHKSSGGTRWSEEAPLCQAVNGGLCWLIQGHREDHTACDGTTWPRATWKQSLDRIRDLETTILTHVALLRCIGLGSMADSLQACAGLPAATKEPTMTERVESILKKYNVIGPIVNEVVKEMEKK